jgi:hypothetical protein
MDGEVLHLIALLEEKWILNLPKKQEKKVNFVFILEIQPLWGLNSHFLRGKEGS